MTTLTKRERIVRAAAGQDVDRIPTIGGWMNGVANLAALGGSSMAEYLRDPGRGMVRANQALGVDALIHPVIPTDPTSIRTGAVEEHKFAGVEPEALLAYANQLPDTEAGVLAAFPTIVDDAERRFRAHFAWAARDYGDIVAIPNFWELGGPFPLYTEYGYTAFFMACAMYPEAVGKIWWARGVLAREKSKRMARLYKELDLVPLMFCGEDLCNNQGPMVAPEFLRRWYMPVVQRIVEPLVDAGVRLVHHCDGDVRPLVADYIAAGFSGLQGFQYEVGVDPWELKKLRSPLGQEMIWFAGLSVSRTLPFGTPEELHAEVDYFFDFTDGGRGLFLFTSNVTGPEVPPESLRTAYAHARQKPFGQTSRPPHRRWPWAVGHPGL